MAYRAPEALGSRHRFNEFDSGEPALDRWLKQHGLEAQSAGSARVFVTTLEDGETVVGYYALAAAEVVPDAAIERSRRGQPQHRSIPAILLARLAVHSEHQRIGVGRSLLQDALVRCVTAADEIGARLLLVHAKHEEAKAWYVQYGFEASPTDPLNLQMLFKDVRKFLRDRGVI